MKIITLLVVGLLSGIGIGWYFGYTRPIAKADRDARQEMRTMQADYSTAAVVAIRAIYQIDSGHIPRAVEFLSDPISRYYRFYALNAGTNEERLKMRTVIEQLARTNQIVAAKITDGMAYDKVIDGEIDKADKADKALKKK